MASKRPISNPRSSGPDSSPTTARLEVRIAPLATPKRRLTGASHIGERETEINSINPEAAAIAPMSTGYRPVRSASEPVRSTVENSPTGARALMRPIVPTAAVSRPIERPVIYEAKTESVIPKAKRTRNVEPKTTRRTPGRDNPVRAARLGHGVRRAEPRRRAR